MSRMRIEELKSAERKYWIYTYVYMLPGFAILISASNDRCIEFVDRTRPFGLSQQNISLISLIVGLALILGGIFIARKQFLAKCPSCGVAINPNQSGIVIATKNCPSCGENVISKDT